jgi:hypothetical protein
VVHLVAVLIGTGAIYRGLAPDWLGQLVLIGAIVEGAVVIGWRLTQLPRSRALEFLLVTPQPAGWLFATEALAGVSSFALITLSGLPAFMLLAVEGRLVTPDVALLLVTPLTWGTITGLGLTAWAYMAAGFRRWAQRAALTLLIFYLGIGLAAGENLRQWVAWLPGQSGLWFLNGFEAFHRYNPFAVMEFWFRAPIEDAWERTFGLEASALVALTAFGILAAWRLKAHYHEFHYQPAARKKTAPRIGPGDRPLSWWAVRRVSRYAGGLNVWLAAAFGCAYAVYVVAGPSWPVWLGQRVFWIFNQAGGVPALACALVVLSAVPAAFQYGLWDSNSQDRCQRLELLLLTRLEGKDYWQAAAAAAWRRGWGYFGIALTLWTAAFVAEQIRTDQLLAAIAAGTIMWGLYFSFGFSAFSRGLHASGLGLCLTVGLPVLAVTLYALGWGDIAAWLPPGNVYQPAAHAPLAGWLGGTIAAGLCCLFVSRRAMAHCQGDLRRWYDRHHGQRVLG